MKKYLLIGLGLIALPVIIAIIKNNYLFSFGDHERIDRLECLRKERVQYCDSSVCFGRSK